MPLCLHVFFPAFAIAFLPSGIYTNQGGSDIYPSDLYSQGIYFKSLFRLTFIIVFISPPQAILTAFVHQYSENMVAFLFCVRCVT